MISRKEKSMIRHPMQPSHPIIRFLPHSARNVRRVGTSSDNLGFIIGLKRLERVRSVQQVNLLPFFRLQTPLCCLKHAHPRPPKTLEPHRARVLGAFDLEADINPAMQLVHLSPDPRHLMREVDLVAQVLSRLG